MTGFWHAYGARVPADGPDLQGSWMQALVGPTRTWEPPGLYWNLGAAYSPSRADGFPELRYLATWDRRPTETELRSLEPGA